MKRVFFLLPFVVLLAASPAFGRGKAKDDTPPAGIVPDGATLSQILRAYDMALGKSEPSVTDTRQETWTFVKAGLRGTETLVRRGSDYYSHIAAGPIVDEYGQLLGHGWHRDANGVVSPVQAPDYTSFEMMIFTRSFDDALDPKNDAKVLGEVQDPAPAFVVEVKATGAKHPEWVFYDKKTGLIDRIVRVTENGRSTATYDDYRTTKGLTQPWHIHFFDGVTALDQDFARTALQVGLTVDQKKFAMPASTYAFAAYNDHIAIPAKVFTDFWRVNIGHDHYRAIQSPTLVVRLNVGGRGLDFALSAAQPHSMIDFEVAAELGLATYGQVTHADGQDVPYDTVLPQADLGGIALRNMAIRATPFHYHLNGETKVVGMIGYDILSTGVFKIDYDNKTLDLYPAKDYDGANPVPDAYMLPILFDSGFPFFKGTIDTHDSENILFDNDFEMSFVFGGFIDRYPESIKDVVTGKDHASAIIPFADAKGYGREVSIWLGNIPDIHFGPAHFQNFQLIAADGDVSFGGHDVDAVMGGDLLQYFDIYMDYPHSRIFLRPNKSFSKAFQVRITP